MPVKIVKINSETLPAIADAIRAKTGSTGSILPSQMAGKIANIHTGGELPVLSSPAGVGHVVSGKEYIDAAGNKQTGTMVVCDTIQEVETIGLPGVGVQVDLESTADGSAKNMTIPEPNLKSENIKNGVSIFNVNGTAKTLRVETGTITPAEDITAIDIVCTAGYNLFVLKLTNGSVSGKSHWKDIYCTPGISAAVQGNRNANAHYVDANGKVQAGVFNVSADAGLKFDAPGIFAAAGCEYTWTAYYWEDNV